MLFKEAATSWLNRQRNMLKESSIAKYSNVLQKHLLPVWGEMAVESIGEETANYFVQSCKKTLAPKTVVDVLNVLRAILRFVKSRIPGYVLPELCGPRLPRSEASCFSREAQKVLEQYLMRHLDACKLGVLLCLYTGLRIGELCALRWSDISLEECRLSVTRTVQRVQQEHSSRKTHIVISAPKTEHSRRSVPIPEALLPLLRAHQAESADCYLLTASPRILEPRQLQFRFRRYQQKCGLRPLKFHALRHTFATRCVELGFEIKSLSEILGHSDIRITLEKYVHLSWEVKQNNMDKLKLLVA